MLTCPKCGSAKLQGDACGLAICDNCGELSVDGEAVAYSRAKLLSLGIHHRDDCVVSNEADDRTPPQGVNAFCTCWLKRLGVALAQLKSRQATLPPSASQDEGTLATQA